MKRDPIFVALTGRGGELARRLAGQFPNSQVHGLANRVEDADVPITAIGDHLRGLFEDRRSIVGIMSSGILIRSLAPILNSKLEEPPVICISEDGKTVVPLLGGHRSGNRLAAKIADFLDCRAAVTTAGDTRLGGALDDPPNGWGVSGMENVKAVTAGLLAGEDVAFVDDTGVGAAWLTRNISFSASNETNLSVRITDKSEPPIGGQVRLHPQTLVVGVGCERDVDAQELIDLALEEIEEARYAVDSIACIATLDLKEDEVAVHALAAELNCPVRLFSADALDAETSRVAEPSDEVFKAVGCHSVAEAAALAGVGKDGEVLVHKQKSARCTFALARAPRVIDVETVGRACGRLSIIGIGPGRADWRAPEATNVIADSTDIVGYTYYLDLLGDLIAGKTVHGYDLGEERDRAIQALTLAAAGKSVSLVSSGDAGIYAMASLVYELIDHGDVVGWRRLQVEVIPGISAVQAAAARAGAPLGHDFCTISLSDLMTPWEVIENRLDHAAAADFVIGLYNPASKRRQAQFERAKEIILRHRDGETTQVIVARNLGRDDEKVSLTTLAAITVDQIDMMTILVIGSSSTRRVTVGGGERVYTPRGYGDRERAE